MPPASEFSSFTRVMLEALGLTLLIAVLKYATTSSTELEADNSPDEEPPLSAGAAEPPLSAGVAELPPLSAGAAELPLLSVELEFDDPPLLITVLLLTVFDVLLEMFPSMVCSLGLKNEM
jgi:hypothetical protein